MLNRLKLVRNSFVRSGKEKKSSEIVIAHSEFDHIIHSAVISRYVFLPNIFAWNISFSNIDGLVCTCIQSVNFFKLLDEKKSIIQNFV